MLTILPQFSVNIFPIFFWVTVFYVLYIVFYVTNLMFFFCKATPFPSLFLNFSHLISVFHLTNYLCLQNNKKNPHYILFCSFSFVFVFDFVTSLSLHFFLYTFRPKIQLTNYIQNAKSLTERNLLTTTILIWWRLTPNIISKFVHNK